MRRPAGTRFIRFGPYGVLLAAASLGEPMVAARAAAGTTPDRGPAAAASAVGCAPGTVPDVNVCVRLPGEDPGAPEAESQAGSHTDRRGRWVVYDQIPRRPDRPAEYDLYEYPVTCARDCVVSGYDLDLPDARQRRGRRLSHVGHGAVDIPRPKGTPITMVALDHQEGDADVVYVGPLFGTTVVTRHALREGGRLRDYLLLFGHLEAPALGLQRGSRLKAGDPVGLVGDTGSPELVHLHLEARRVRDGVDALKLSIEALASGDSTIVCDPRNVLPLR